MGHHIEVWILTRINVQTLSYKYKLKINNIIIIYFYNLLLFDINKLAINNYRILMFSKTICIGRQYNERRMHIL